MKDGYEAVSADSPPAELPLKMLEGVLYGGREEPAVAAAAGAVAVACLLACLLAATGLQVAPSLRQLAMRLLEQQGAREAREWLLADDDDSSDSSSNSSTDSEDEENEPAAAAAAAVEEQEAGMRSTADLLRAAPAKADEVELLTGLAFQMVMARELSAVARSL
jgi:hypothetical protein